MAILRSGKNSHASPLLSLPREIQLQIFQYFMPTLSVIQGFDKDKDDRQGQDEVHDDDNSQDEDDSQDVDDSQDEDDQQDEDDSSEEEIDRTQENKKRIMDPRLEDDDAKYVRDRNRLIISQREEARGTLLTLNKATYQLFGPYFYRNAIFRFRGPLRRMDLALGSWDLTDSNTFVSEMLGNVRHMKYAIHHLFKVPQPHYLRPPGYPFMVFKTLPRPTQQTRDQERIASLAFVMCMYATSMPALRKFELVYVLDRTADNYSGEEDMMDGSQDEWWTYKNRREGHWLRSFKDRMLKGPLKGFSFSYTVTPVSHTFRQEAMRTEETILTFIKSGQ